MKIASINKKYSIFGVISYLILVTISLLTTSNESRPIIELIRICAAGGVIISFVIPLIYKSSTYKYQKKINRVTAIGVAFFGGYIIYGLTISMINNSFRIISETIILDVVVISIGILIFSTKSRFLFSVAVIKYFLIYIVCGLIITIISNGIDLSFPPHFIFSYSDRSYSQGASKFFGLGAIAAAYLISIYKSKKAIASLFFLATIFLFLSFLGGARGDSVLAFIVVLGFWLVKKPMQFIIAVMGIIVIALISINDWSFLESFKIFQRLVNTGDYGERDLLITQSVSLLIQNPSCLILGCGFGYFQYFNGFEPGLYPHNAIMESIITFGIPLTVFFSITVAIGIKKYLSNPRLPKAFLLFYAYIFLVGLKSGSITSSWMLISATIFFASLSFNFLLINKKISFLIDKEVN